MPTPVDVWFCQH